MPEHLRAEYLHALERAREGLVSARLDGFDAGDRPDTLRGLTPGVTSKIITRLVDRGLIGADGSLTEAGSVALARGVA